MMRCELKSSAISPRSKPLPAAVASVKWRDYKRLTGAAIGAKRKGVAEVRLADGRVRLAEIHWYEASGIGRKEYKIKRFLD